MYSKTDGNREKIRRDRKRVWPENWGTLGIGTYRCSAIQCSPWRGGWGAWWWYGGWSRGAGKGGGNV